MIWCGFYFAYNYFLWRKLNADSSTNYVPCKFTLSSDVKSQVLVHLKKPCFKKETTTFFF